MLSTRLRRFAALGSAAAVTSAVIVAVALALAGGSGAQADASSATAPRQAIGELTLAGTEPIAIEDINIGVGELQEYTISKSIDSQTPVLVEDALARRVFPSATLTVELGSSGRAARITYHFEGVAVSRITHVSDSDDLVEQISFYYEKVRLEWSVQH